MLWHILTCVPQRELRAQAMIEQLGMHVMLPVEYRWHDVRKGGSGKKGKTEKVVKPHPLWPRYIFAGCERFHFPWRELYSIQVDGRPVVTGALFHNGIPYALSHVERLRVGALCDIEKPQVPPMPSRRLIVGDAVRILSGPFAGQLHKVHAVAKNHDSIKVMVSLFGSLAEAKLPVDMVEAA